MSKSKARPQRWVNSGVRKEAPLRDLDTTPAGKRQAAYLKSKKK
jgi:hypothetical protein